MGCAYFAILAIKRVDPRYWLWFGVIAGVGLEEKYSIAFFGLGIVIGLIFTEQRRVFLNKGIWLGGIAAFLIFLPNLLWNIHYHWPFLELMHAIRAEGRDVVLPAGQFFLQQTLLVNPLTAPIWICGLLALLFSARLKPYRFLGMSYIVCYGIFFALPGAGLSEAVGRRRSRRGHSVEWGGRANPPSKPRMAETCDCNGPSG
jgi:4-amino-4-deoxy-L-arabinose transferase-like glycosyltransferase